jgi:hypothetical protein
MSDIGTPFQNMFFIISSFSIYVFVAVPSHLITLTLVDLTFLNFLIMARNLLHKLAGTSHSLWTRPLLIFFFLVRILSESIYLLISARGILYL